MNLIGIIASNAQRSFVLFRLKLRQWLKLLILLVPLFVLVGPFNALAADCRGYLELLQPYVSSLRTFHPKPGLVPIEPEVLEFVKTEGGSVEFLGKGDFGRLYKWVKPGRPTIVIKYFIDEKYDWREQIVKEDQSFKVLRQILKPVDGFKVVEEVYPRTLRMRFYQYIAGETYGSFLRNESVPALVRLQIKTAFDKMQTQLIRRLIDFFGLKRVAVEPLNLEKVDFDPMQSVSTSRVKVSMDDARPIRFNLHIHNVIVEAATGQLWIIDPL